MRVAPDDLDPDDLRGVLRRAWGIRVEDLRYAPLGYGAHHWTGTDDTRRCWWVSAHRVRAGSDLRRIAAALRTAAALHGAGLEFVLAPLPTLDGEPVATLGPYAVDLQPFVPDATEGGGPVVAPLLARLHAATPLVADLAERDDLALTLRPDLERALAETGRPWPGGPFSEPFRSLLAAAATSVRAALQRYDGLVASVAAQPLRITHGEPKPDNLLRTADGTGLLIDWDTALLAPAARDLWWLTEAGAAIGAYEELIGDEVPAEGLELYRLRWALTDLAEFAHELRAPHPENADTRIAFDAVRRLLAGGVLRV